jgi:hypothetical protein
MKGRSKGNFILIPEVRWAAKILSAVSRGEFKANLNSKNFEIVF